jgi:hypothetical protein
MRNEKIKKKVYSSPAVSEWSSHEEDEMSGTVNTQEE